MISLYQKVTDAIISQLENGTMPWVRPWSVTAGRNIPCNAVTNRPYSGVNVVLLWSTLHHNFKTPRFVTFKQANKCGGRVIKGQNGFKIYYVKHVQSKQENEDTDDTRSSYTLLREYTVFNIDQCDGLPESIVNPTPLQIRNQSERDETADEFIDASQASIRHGGAEAFYSSGSDVICLPDWEQFNNRDAYYDTAFHELTHWTGHKSRLDRDLKNRFGTNAYAAEELIAELGSAYLCAEFGIDNYAAQASYINNWLTLLRKDNRAIFTAASKATKAAEYLRSLALRETEWPSTSPIPQLDSPSIQPQMPAKSSWDTNTKYNPTTTDRRVLQ
jgi:antirestriction protein ArdC